jgi:hypothetical protein
MEEQQRQELLDRRAGGGGPLFDLNADMAARRHIEGSKRVLEEAYQTGVGMLADMTGQRERLKVGGQLGLQWGSHGDTGGSRRVEGACLCV